MRGARRGAATTTGDGQQAKCVLGLADTFTSRDQFGCRALRSASLQAQVFFVCRSKATKTVAVIPSPSLVCSVYCRSMDDGQFTGRAGGKAHRRHLLIKCVAGLVREVRATGARLVSTHVPQVSREERLRTQEWHARVAWLGACKEFGRACCLRHRNSCPIRARSLLDSSPNL